VPKEYILSLASSVNAEPLPLVPETFGVRLPPAQHCLTEVDFDLVPNKPPPEDPLYEEYEEEIEYDGDDGSEAGTPSVNDLELFGENDDAGDGEEDAAKEEEDDERDLSMAPATPQANGASAPAKRKLEEDDEYD